MDKKINENEKCRNCFYFQENEIGVNECHFPWFDWDEEDVLFAECQKNEKGAENGKH